MDDAADRRRVFFAHDGDGVVFGVARVDHRGKRERFRHAEERAEDFLLLRLR